MIVAASRKGTICELMRRQSCSYAAHTSQLFQSSCNRRHVATPPCKDGRTTSICRHAVYPLLLQQLPTRVGVLGTSVETGEVLRVISGRTRRGFQEFQEFQCTTRACACVSVGVYVNMTLCDHVNNDMRACCRTHENGN